MSGPPPDSSAAAAHGRSTLPAAAWGDTHPGKVAQPAAPATSIKAAADAAENLPTIGHIGRYALKYKIGEGGLGTVFAAHDPLLSRLIAIKTVNVEIAADERESFNALFLNEARAAGGLSHPHIVTVFDAGVSEQGAYIAMELLKGRDLRQLRLEGWRPSPSQAATIVRRVADALAYAHSRGVVHRDIKPANIFMVGRTQPCVLDFGIARIAHQHEAQGEGDVVGGSPYYMSPEQVRRQPEDRRCDVFSLGVVLYELLTDTRPFRGNTLSEISEAVVGLKPPSPSEIDPNLPAGLCEITMRAIEKDPEDRYRSARALSRELRHWLEENPQEREGAASAATERRWIPMAATAAIAGLAAAIGWMLWPSEEPVAMAAVPIAKPAASPAMAATPSEPAASVMAASSVSATPAADTPPATDTPMAAAPAAESASAAGPPPKPGPVRERGRRLAATSAGPAANTVAAPAGMLHLAVSPWGQVEINGKAVGTAPPLNQLSLPPGRHTVTLRNSDFPPHSVTVQIVPGQPANLKHRFGS